MEFFKLKEKISEFPKAPGVYFFRGSKKEVLYIGKATNLRSRVQSYFRGGEASRLIGRMIKKVAEVDFEETDSVLEALVLESNLIKKHQPKYNVQEKDDKSFSYFVVTKEEYPRVLIFRKTEIDFEKLEAKGYKLKDIFGPYTSKKQMQVALKIIRKIFPFHALKQKSEKGCLDFQIGLCPGPYEKAISKEDYRKNIRNIKMFLEGKKKRLITTLEKEMKEAAKKNEFEKAAELRNKIFALNHIRDIALMGREFESESQVTGHKSTALRIEAYDISNISGHDAVGSMVVFKNAKPDKSQYRKFKIKTVEGSNDVGMMREVLARRISNDWPKPDLVLLDGGQGHLNMAADLFKTLGFNAPLAAVAKGPARKNLKLYISNHKKISTEIREIFGDNNLVKYIMDEAHRFAISYHRKRRKKSFSS